MASRDKMDMLRAFLGSLPPGVAGNVARAVEMDRMNNGRTLPHDLILETLRQSLRDDAKAGRAATPLRLFCRPFEDLLVSDGFSHKQKGRIPRGSIAPVWNWLSQELMPAEATSYALAVKTAAIGHTPEQLANKASGFWKAASETLRAKLGTENGRRAARQVLGNDAVIEDAREMALMLAAAQEICELQDILPQSMPSLTPAAIQAFRTVQERLAARLPDAAPYLAVVLMKRLEQPWEALRLCPPQAQGEGEAMGDPDLGIVGGLLLAAIDAHRGAITSADPQRFDADALVRHLEGYMTVSNGVTKEVEVRPNSALHQRLVEDRVQVIEAMENFLGRAPEQIFAALSIQTLDDGALVLDLSQSVDPDKSDSALSYARLIEGCRELADTVSFGTSLKRPDEQIGAALIHYNEAIVRELAGADDEKRLKAERYAAVATELTAILVSPEQGEQLRQKRRATAPSLAA